MAHVHPHRHGKVDDKKKNKKEKEVKHHATHTKTIHPKDEKHEAAATCPCAAKKKETHKKK